MPKVSQPLEGTPLVVHRREPPFGFWPTKHTGGRPGIQTQMFANDPWNVIESYIDARCSQDRRSSAKAFFAQAKDYYQAATTASYAAAKPVLTYYSLLNLCKSFILTVGNLKSLDQAKHGISESNAGLPISQHSMRVFRSTSTSNNVFAELYNLICGASLQNDFDVPISDLLPQIILGHRMWCSTLNRRERFVRIAKAQYMTSSNSSQVWLRFFIFQDDLYRMHISQKDILATSGTSNLLHFVNIRQTISNRPVLCLEERVPTAHNGWPSDQLRKLSAKYETQLWMILANTEPYRKYYLYLSPASEIRLPQVLSAYLLSYYLGSVTRYRPVQFGDMLASNLGGQVREFIDHQIVQFLYMMASYFAERDVVRPAVI